MDSKQGNVSECLSSEEKEKDDDWTFNGSDTKYLTHGLHPYPARMIPKVAAKLILEYSGKSELMWDPFCGSGSTLVEAMLNERQSIGTDLNPFATFLSKVKTTPIDVRQLRKTCNQVLIATSKRMKRKKSKAKIPTMHNPDYYFKKNVQQNLAEIKDEIFSIQNEDIKDFLRLCLASTAREVSNLKKNEFKIVHMGEDKVKKFNPDVQVTFGKHVERCILLMDAFVRNMPDDWVIPRIELVDNRNAKIGEQTVDVVVTSPPYGDHSTTVAYGQFSRYPGIWLGIDEDDLKSVDRMGLGGRSHTNYSSDILQSKLLHKTYIDIAANSEKRAKEFFNFFIDLNGSLVAMKNTLKVGGHACIVVGNRLMSRIRVPTNEIIVDLSGNIGMMHVRTIEREIPTKRMPWQNAPENIEGYSADTMHNEHIVILKRT